MAASITTVAGMPVDTQEISFRADRARLKGRMFQPMETSKAAIVLHGATGVPQRFYRHFAAWLAGQGYACLTYDYRDFGESANGSLRKSKATMADWGVLDQAAAQRAMEAHVPDVPLWVIGHSLGGLMVPFQEGADRIDRLITIASGPVHLRDHPWPYRAVAGAFWYGPGAWATGALGYLPAKALRFGHDLPAGVYWQWRRWCTRREFFLGDVGRGLPVPDWRAFRNDLKLVAVADDDLVPVAAVWRHMQNFPEARKSQLTLRPADFGLKRLGHLGAFRIGSADIWPNLIS